MNARDTLRRQSRTSKGVDRRGGDRRIVEEASTLRGPEDEPIDVAVVDLSVTGFNVACDRSLRLGSVVHLGLPGNGRFAARVLRQDGNNFGCEFIELVPQEAVERAFEGSNVAHLFVTADDQPFPPPAVSRWPRAARGWFMLALGIAAWALIAWLVLR